MRNKELMMLKLGKRSLIGVYTFSLPIKTIISVCGNTQSCSQT